LIKVYCVCNGKRRPKVGHAFGTRGCAHLTLKKWKRKMKKSLLRKVLALIDTPEKWCKGASVIETPGCETRRCVYGAYFDAAAGSYRLKHLDNVASLFADCLRAVTFNDHPDTTHEDVMALFDLAIAFDEVGEL
jgi:hypothetical protein